MRRNDEGRLANLDDLQRQIVQIGWANAPVTAETVREKLSRPLKESTVRTVLRRLEDKELHHAYGRGAYLCLRRGQAAGRVAAKVVQRIIDWICNGSVEEALVGVVDSNMIDRKQLRMLLDRMNERKTGRRCCWRSSSHRHCARSLSAPLRGSARR